MSAFGTYASGGTRKGPGGRRQVWSEGRWRNEDELTPKQLRDLSRPPDVEEPDEPRRTLDPAGPTIAPARTGTRKGPRGTPQVQIRGKWISERIADTWDAYVRLRDVKAVADEVGSRSENVRNALKRYEKLFGINRPAAAKPEMAPAPADEAPAAQTDREEGTDLGGQAAPGPRDTDGLAPPEPEEQTDQAALIPAEALPAPAESTGEAPHGPERGTWLTAGAPAPKAESHSTAATIVEIAYAVGYASGVLRMVSLTETAPTQVQRQVAAAAAQQLEDLL